jgi:hypothetical protein
LTGVALGASSTGCGSVFTHRDLGVVIGPQRASEGADGFDAGLALSRTEKGPLDRASAETMTRICVLGVVAGAQKIARPSRTAIATGLPTRQFGSSLGSVRLERCESIHPPDKSSPIMPAPSHGHKGSLDFEPRSQDREHNNDSCTEFPAGPADTKPRE